MMLGEDGVTIIVGVSFVEVVTINEAVFDPLL